MKWVNFYKKHREILDSDIIHVRRPDGRDYDAILHVNPGGKEKGLLMIYNPLDEIINRTLKVNLYYTGLIDKATLIFEDGKSMIYPLNNKGDLLLPVNIKARGTTWFVIE